MSNFVKDLKFGQEAEKAFARYLIDYPKLVSIEFSQGKCADYDIKIKTTEKEITYEIKSDSMAEQTGNFVIETRFKGNASGIYTSKADYIVYYIKGEWYIQERGELILRLGQVEKRETRGGDGWNSTLYVISCDKLPELFEHLNVNEVINEGNKKA